MNVRFQLLTMAVFALVLPASGCATLFAPGPDRIAVSSNPAGARVFLDSQEVGVTPLTVSLDRKVHTGSIRLEAAGYQPAAAQRTKSFNPIAFLNCFTIFPWLVDLLTENYQRFDTTPISVSLIPAYGGPPAQGYPAQNPYPPAYPPRYPAPQPQPSGTWGTAPPGYPQPVPAYPPQPVPAYPPQPGYPQQPYPQRPAPR